MSLSIKIKGIGTYIPERVVKNDFFIEHFKKEENGCVDVEGLMKSLGRDERHFAERGESSLSMGYQASLDVLDKTNTDVKDLDMIVFVSDTPEYTSPTNASMIANNIGATNVSVVYDMNCNCTGMILALDNVSTYLSKHDNVRTALVVGSMYASSIVRWNDPVTYPNFGDAGSAVVLQKAYEEDCGIVYTDFKAMPEYSNQVKSPACGHSNELMGKLHKYYRRLEWIQFDTGFVTDILYDMFTKAFKEVGIADSDVAYYALSQFSIKYNLELLNKLGVSEMNKHLFNGNKYGYTGCSSPIIALSDVWDKAKDMHGKYLILSSYGAGVNLGCMIYKI